MEYQRGQNPNPHRIKGWEDRKVLRQGNKRPIHKIGLTKPKAELTSGLRLSKAAEGHKAGNIRMTRNGQGRCFPWKSPLKNSDTSRLLQVWQLLGGFTMQSTFGNERLAALRESPILNHTCYGNTARTRRPYQRTGKTQPRLYTSSLD